MLTFKFSGALRRFYRKVDLNVDSPAQGLKLLFAQNQEFKKAFLNTPLRMRVAKSDVTNDTLSFELNRHPADGSTVLFVPVVSGAISGTALLITTLVISAASIAYSIYSSRNLKTQNSAKAAETEQITNNSYSSVENRIGQGHPVPLLYGEMLVGSNVLSLGIDTSNTDNWDELIS